VIDSPAVKHVDSRTRVRYKETDQMGIAHHSNYIVWFEIGRTDLCRATGFPYAEIERRGYLLVVTEIGCRFKIPFRYDEEVIIRTAVAEAASRSIRFDYELRNGTGETVHATGFSSHLWIDRDTRKPVRADADVMKAFEPFLRGERTRPSRTAPAHP
jgi:acyl-CoA thioester hydrolase